MSTEKNEIILKELERVASSGASLNQHELTTCFQQTVAILGDAVRRIDELEKKTAPAEEKKS